MSRQSYCPNSKEQTREMLDVIGVSAIEDLFAGIPAGLRARSFSLPEGMSEFEAFARMQKLAATDAVPICFVGGGLYDHIIPSVVDHLAGRAEFYTAYTHYQPECSQGTLQALFEYQTVITRLTGMEVSNASMYDGGTALAEAATMALRITGKSRIVMDEGINPFYRRVVKTYLQSLSVEVVDIPHREGILDRNRLVAAVDGTTAAILVQNPNFFGSLDDFSDIAEIAHGKGALLVASVYPVSLGMVKSPGEMGADIVAGDGQSLGSPLSFGGPSFGFMTTRKQYIRNLPGRIVGETIDHSGKRGFVLTLQAREQHIKRHKATSNICSNQSLCALRALIFLSALGREGFSELAHLNYDKAEYAKEILGRLKGVTVLNPAATFNEFTLALPKEADRVVEEILAKGIAAGVPLGGYYAGLRNCLTVTVTERRDKDEIDALAAALEEALWS